MTQAGVARTLLSRTVRAYFAPTPGAPLNLTTFADNPPDGWTDLGWIENLKRTSGTRIEAVRAGAGGAAIAQYRGATDAGIEFDFMESGKLQLALSACGQQLNVLGAGTAVPVSSQSTRTQLLVDAENSPFVPGDLIAVDVDYSGQTGPVGCGIATAYVTNAADAHGDVDYIRRVTVNVARVLSIDAKAVNLQQPLPCAIAAGAKAQKVFAFGNAEGDSYCPEWSGLFVVEGATGGRLCYYYPRLQAASAAQETSISIEPPFEVLSLHASLRALPDGDQLLCYRLYFPN